MSPEQARQLFDLPVIDFAPGSIHGEYCIAPVRYSASTAIAPPPAESQREIPRYDRTVKKAPAAKMTKRRTRAYKPREPRALALCSIPDCLPGKQHHWNIKTEQLAWCRECRHTCLRALLPHVVFRGKKQTNELVPYKPEKLRRCTTPDGNHPRWLSHGKQDGVSRIRCAQCRAGTIGVEAAQ